MPKKTQRRRRVGFTLMEVLLVLAILVILGSMVGIFFQGARKKALVQATTAQISMFEEMMEHYSLDVGSYPSTQQGLQALRTPPSDIANPQKWGGPYAKKDIPPDPWGNPYQYEQSGEQFQISSWGPDGQEGTDDDIRVISG